MRFLYHHRTAGRGGEGVHITSVVRALVAAGHHVDVVSPPGVDPLRSGAAVPLDKGATDVGGIERIWKWISCSTPQGLFEVAELAYNLYAAVRLLPPLCRRKHDIFYERYAFFLFAGVCVARLCGRRVILEVNEVAGVQRARSQTFLRLARWSERVTFGLADEILTVSSFLQREVVQRGGRPGRVHVVPNAIDPERFNQPRNQTVRCRLGLDDTVVVGFVGWFDAWDRLDRLIDVFKHVHERHSHARLLLVGDGPVASELSAAIQRARLEGLVLLTGPIPRAEVPSYIDAMDICVLPDSNTFGSPLVLFEFMAMGKPVIAPDLAPVRDVIDDGATGWIVGREDAAALQAAIERLIAWPALARRVGEAARQRVFERHTWSAVAATVERLARGQVDVATGSEAAEGRI